MNTTPPNTVIFVLLLIAVVLAVVAWLTVQRQRSLRLRRRFGPQYDLTVSEFHSRTTTETELLDVRNASPD
jgi:sensor domain CHASE-containing protein